MAKKKTATGTARLDVMKTYKLYIGGKFPRTESGRYYPLKNKAGAIIANLCLASRKDAREAVVAARSAFCGWAGSSAYLKGQILYRIAEVLEGRKEQFVAELRQTGIPLRTAEKEVTASIDRLVYYAGWTDKLQQVFSSVNPVATSHFNFSMLEPTGVVAITSPAGSPLLGLISHLAPALCGGNTVVLIAPEDNPLPAVSLMEVLATSDVPGGVVNLLTGKEEELIMPLASHMDVNAFIYTGDSQKIRAEIENTAADNVKRAIFRSESSYLTEDSQSPYWALDTTEVKTTWHPVGI